MKVKLVLDNKGRTFDRYSIIFDNGLFLSLSQNCDSPQGVSQWGQWSELPDSDAEALKEYQISFEDLPANVQQHVNRILEKAQ